jgi:hypothetical protein
MAGMEDFALVVRFLTPIDVVCLSLVDKASSSQLSIDAPLVELNSFWRGAVLTVASRRREAQQNTTVQQNVAVQSAYSNVYLSFRSHSAKLYMSDVRRQQLSVALSAEGLELRSDSVLCCKFIDGNLQQSLNYVVEQMAEMNFYFSQTR